MIEVKVLEGMKKGLCMWGVGDREEWVCAAVMCLDAWFAEAPFALVAGVA